MILRALYDYYQRFGSNLAPEGLEYKEIPFVVVIDNDGKFVRLDDRRNEKNKGSEFLVVKSVNRSSNPVSNVIWDNSSYVLGITEANISIEFIDRLRSVVHDETKDKNLSSEEKDKIVCRLFKKMKAISETDDLVSECRTTIDKGIDVEKEDVDALTKKITSWKKEIQKNIKNHSVFICKVKEIADKLSNNTDVQAIIKFYVNESVNIDALKRDTKWNELCKNLTKNISFIIDGDTQIIAEKDEVTSCFLPAKLTDEFGKLCLVCGERGQLVETTTATSIVGSQATAKLVSFQVGSGYDSYGKTKGYNAPISKSAEFAYTTALNHLLRSDSHNKFIIGSRTFLFWASSQSKASKASESGLFSLFGKQDEDNPNKRIEFVRHTFMSIYSGDIPSEKDDKFYILGLAPNAARIAVVYWKEIPIRDFARIITRHFSDMEIVDTRKEKKPYVGLHSILGAVTLGGKSSDAAPNLPDAVVKSIFQGLPYPASLYQSCIRRIRAEQSLNITRAAIIKAYLNRLNDNNNKKLDIMLDKENQNQGYLCGRLFAVLDKIQEDANNIHSIRERYMNSASATPATVFATILNLSAHHLEKLNTGSQIHYEKLKQEIISKFDADGFPTHLDLQDQGRFFVGYYHQRQDFFTSKENKESEE